MSRQIEWAVEQRDTGASLARGIAGTTEDAQHEAVNHALEHGRDQPVRLWIREGTRFLIRCSIGSTQVAISPHGAPAHG